MERFNRSLKEIMWKSFSLNSSYTWIDKLQEYLNYYNQRVHRTIKMAPANVTQADEARLLKTVYNYPTQCLKPPKFAIGDHVRLSKYKGIFEKGYTPNWGTELFKVINVNTGWNPETYKLMDIHNEKILGGVYREEIQKVKHSDGYLIERVLKRKPGKIFVKFLGFASKHNGWIDDETQQ